MSRKHYDPLRRLNDPNTRALRLIDLKPGLEGEIRLANGTVIHWKVNKVKGRGRWRLDVEVPLGARIVTGK